MSTIQSEEQRVKREPLMARASRLVVISAGAFGSPSILERSGIGAKDVLKSNNVHNLLIFPELENTIWVGITEYFNVNDDQLMTRIHKIILPSASIRGERRIRNDGRSVSRDEEQLNVRNNSGFSAAPLKLSDVLVVAHVKMWLQDGLGKGLLAPSQFR